MADSKISNLTELTVPPDPTDELVVVDKSDTSMAASGTDKRLQYSNLYDWAEAGDLSTIQPDDAAAAGASVEIPRADHKHAIVAAAPGTIQPDDAAAEGTATSFARSDHKHAIVGAAPSNPLTGVNAEGTSTSFARADHDHLLPVWYVTPSFIPLAAPASTATGATNTYYALRFSVFNPTTITGIEVKNGATANGNLRPYLCQALTGTVVSGSIASPTAQTGTNVRQRVPFDSTYAAVPGIYYAVMHYTSATATAFMAPVLGTVGQTATTATPNTLTVTAADLTATSVALIQPY